MGELKKHQPSMTIDEQISNLKEIGLYLFNANLRQLIFPEIEKN